MEKSTYQRIASLRRNLMGFTEFGKEPQNFMMFFTRNCKTQRMENALHLEKYLNTSGVRLNRLEASFSSKLVATVNPDLPVWDAEVLRNLQIKKPLSTDKNRLKKTIEIYDEIIVWYANYLKNEKGQIQLAEFNNKFPNSGISDLKKIDLILWQTREK